MVGDFSFFISPVIEGRPFGAVHRRWPGIGGESGVFVSEMYLYFFAIDHRVRLDRGFTRWKRKEKGER